MSENMIAGKVVSVWWSSDDRGPVRVRLVRRYEHPAGNGWYVNIYQPHRSRFSKVEQAIGDESLAAIRKATGGAK